VDLSDIQYGDECDDDESSDEIPSWSIVPIVGCRPHSFFLCEC
jgi:hypothetical protein